MLVKNGFPAEFWNELVVEKRLPFKAPAALYTQNDAEINPYKFVVSLTEQLIAKGLDLFENTYANVIEDEGNEITLHTMNGTFTTSRIVYTTGYERLPYGKMKGLTLTVLMRL